MSKRRAATLTAGQSKASDFVLWGSAGHAKVLASIIALQGGRVIALFDSHQMMSALPGVPLYVGRSGFDTWWSNINNAFDINALAAIGGAKGRDRIELQSLFLARGLRVPTLVHPQASVCETAELGAGTQVLANGVVASGARLGAACIVNHGASVDHECLLGGGVHLAPGATLCGCVEVEDCVFIGAGAVVLPRLRIGENAIVGAGSVVTRDVPQGGIVVGNPARPIGELQRSSRHNES